MPNRLFRLLFPVLLLPVLACRGGGGGGSLQITPATVVTAGYATTRFTADGGSVTWAVQEGALGGAITTDGTYTAPNKAGTYHVTAQGGGKAGSATVQVGFTTARHMTARYAFSSTLLPDGRVLVAGGWYNSSDYSASAEIYDPVADQSSATGYLATGRENATGTLMPGGRVWILGGNGAFYGLASTEIFDPTTGLFQPGPSLQAARTGHRVFPLSGGRLLVVGGFTSQTSDSQLVTTAELYDPAAGAFVTLASHPAVALGAPASCVLADGRILFSKGTALEIFDPATVLFTTLPATLTQARYGHTSTTLPSGKVLLAGGVDGTYFGQPVVKVELLDPSSWATVAAGAFSEPRSADTVTLLANGRVVFTGGSAKAGGSGGTSLVEYFDPQAQAIQTLGYSYWQRSGASAFLLPDGRVVLMGGLGGGNGSGDGGVIPDEFICPF